MSRYCGRKTLRRIHAKFLFQSPWRNTVLTSIWSISTALHTATANKVSSDGLCRVGVNTFIEVFTRTLTKTFCHRSGLVECWLAVVGRKLLYMVKPWRSFVLTIIAFKLCICQHGNQFCHQIILCTLGSISEYSFLCTIRLDIALGNFSDCLSRHFYYFIALPDNASFSFYYNSLHPLSYTSVFRNSIHGRNSPLLKWPLSLDEYSRPKTTFSIPKMFVLP